MGLLAIVLSEESGALVRYSARMPIEIKLFFTVADLCILPFMLWVMRPSQSHAVSPKWFRLGSRDLFFYWLFQKDGKPRKYSWLFVVIWFALFLVLVWLLPTAP